MKKFIPSRSLHRARLAPAGPRLEARSRRGWPRREVDGSAIGEIEVPRLGLWAIVIQGDSPEILRLAIGHSPETALPGARGNVGLASHRAGILRRLRHIHSGDTIVLNALDGTTQYRVESAVVVASRDPHVPPASFDRTLTISARFPFDCVGVPARRLVVQARQITLPRLPSARLPARPFLVSPARRARRARPL